jgi:hypothetical protein
MEYADHVRAVPVTPEYVLSVLADQHRQQCQWDCEVDPEARITFEMTVDEWQMACDLLGWRGLAKALDEYWQMGRPEDEWRQVLKPEVRRTLRDVCNFISAHGVREEVVPATILGARCAPAGAFFAVCSRLRQAGVDVDGIAPSTPLGDYARKHPYVFLGPVSKLAPNALPDVRIETPWHFPAVLGMLLAMLLVIYAVPMACVWLRLPLWLCIGAAPAPGYLTWRLGVWLVRKIHPRRVEFGDIKTFGDLARVIAERSGDTPVTAKA